MSFYHGPTPNEVKFEKTIEEEAFILTSYLRDLREYIVHRHESRV